jgi:ABC-type sugar transport system ATPase subunit
VDVLEPLGDALIVVAKTADQTIKALLPAGTALRPNQEVELQVAGSKIHVFDTETGAALPAPR